MSAINGEQSLMHMIQAFLVETIREVQAGLPADVVVTTAGRTILRGEKGARTFGVRVKVEQFDGDMWPHVEAVLELDGQEEALDIHPDTTVSGHAQRIVDELARRLA